MFIRRIYIFVFFWFFLFGSFINVYSRGQQRKFTLTGNIGFSYYGYNPLLLNGKEGWHYGQKFIGFNLGGYVWDPRFVLFTIGGDYGALSYNQDDRGPNFRNIGYRFQLRFFPQKKINFGFSYDRKRFDFKAGADQIEIMKTNYKNYTLDFRLSRIRSLPLIKLKYSNYDFSGFTRFRNGSRKNLDLIANKTFSKFHFDLNYRHENRNNKFFGLDRSTYNLRTNVRFDASKKTELRLKSKFSGHSIGLPIGTRIRNSSRGLSFRLRQRFSSKLLADFLSNYDASFGSGYKFHLFNVGASFDYYLRKNFVLSPEIYYSTSSVLINKRQERIREPRIGLELRYQTEISKVRLTSVLGISYRYQKSRISSDREGLSRVVSLGIASGRRERLFISLSYQYNSVDFDISEQADFSQSFNNSFLEETDFTRRISMGIGYKQNNHQARIELRSGIIRGLDFYLHSNYLRSQYNEYLIGNLFQGKTAIQILDNGLTVGFLKRITLTAIHGISKIHYQEGRADYNSFIASLGAKITKGLDFKAQRMKKYRTDAFFKGDHELAHDVYLSYSIGRFSLSLVYRKIDIKMRGFARQDEVIFVKISRSFGLSF